MFDIIQHHMAGCIEESGEMSLAVLEQVVKNNLQQYEYIVLCLTHGKV